ncbi:recombinase family protein [Intestinibacillus massiliensis]
MTRVAAYCRVSTDKDDQAGSLESQKRYFAEYIGRNPAWELAEVYADEGVTGTSTKKRAAFNRMIADAQARRFDLVVTKEISRFARNTLDSILYTRKLKGLGVGVIFMNDNINTLDPDAELRLTIMSSIAQEESRKTSDRVKWGQKRRMEQGVVFGRDLLGYDVRDGKLYRNEAGAKTVRLIFHKFVQEGKGAHTIARELQEGGIPTATYMKQWSGTVVLRILRNEKYCGDLIQKKTITPNYLTHEKKYNRGEEEFVVLRDHHEPIISRELFDQAQQELARRSPPGSQKAKHSNRYCFSGKVKCGLCGSSYVARTKKRRDGSVYKAWRCSRSASHGRCKTDPMGNAVGCDGRAVSEDCLRLVLRQVVKNLPLDKAALAATLGRIIRPAMKPGGEGCRPEKLAGKLQRLAEKRQSLLELYLNRDISKAEFQHMAARCDAEAAGLAAEQEALARRGAQDGCTDAPYGQAEAYIRALMSGDVWDDAFYRRLLNRITVLPGGVLEIRLQMLPQSARYLVADPQALQKGWDAAPPEAKAAARGHFASSVGTEELAHLEMIAAIVYQLTRNLTPEEIKAGGYDAYYVDHTTGIYPQFASGTPWSAMTFQSKGDAITDLFEDLAAEQKARTTYDNLLRLIDDPDVRDPIKFLRAREVVHFQRFGEPRHAT